MADCDANYLRFLKLFPEYQSASSRRFVLNGQNRVVTITVLERTPYTTLLTLKQTELEQTQGNGIGWLHIPALKVRLYHDARVAEVLDCEGHKKPDPRFEYPNPKMYQQDEKAQWNRFLADLLAHCLQHGYETGDCFDRVSS
ncbi:MAG: DUF1249 domain-containing protein [Porticoccaceae bacterium]|nr:DUF1249 domain-containing protein [Porticoccaceae bacterium]